MKAKGRIVRVVFAVTALLAAVVVTRLLPPPSPVTSPPAPEATAASAPATSTQPAATTSRERRWQRVARSFISRYGNTKGGRSAWLQRMRPVVSDDVFSGLQTVRLQNLPTGTFRPGTVLAVGEVGGTMRFPLRGGSIGAIAVTVSVSDEGALRVTGFVPVSAQEVS